MGTLQHSVQMFTSYERRTLEALRDEVVTRLRIEGGEMSWDRIVSPIIEGTTNGYASFFLAPDGSKLGWPTQTGIRAIREWAVDRAKSTPSVDILSVGYGECGSRVDDSLTTVDTATIDEYGGYDDED